MASDFLAYVNDREYFSYVHKLHTTQPFWRPLRWIAHFLLPLHYRNECEQNMPKATPRLGLVLMGNVVLHDVSQAGPALVLATDRFDFEGLNELHDVSLRIEELRGSPDPAISESINAIFEDEDYQRFRRRSLPACLQAPTHILLFDEQLSGNTLVRIDSHGRSILHPLIVLFATDTDVSGAGAWSSAVPSRITGAVLDVLFKARASTPPPLPRAAA